MAIACARSGRFYGKSAMDGCLGPRQGRRLYIVFKADDLLQKNIRRGKFNCLLKLVRDKVEDEQYRI